MSRVSIYCTEIYPCHGADDVIPPQAQFLREYKLVVVGGGGKLMLALTNVDSFAAWSKIFIQVLGSLL